MVDFEPKEWKRQDGPFDLVISAKDDYGNICNDFRCYYSISSKDSEPVIDYDLRYDSVNGYIIIPIDFICNIKIHLYYPKDTSRPEDLSEYLISESIDIPYVTGITAKYVGPQLEVSDVVNIELISAEEIYNRGPNKKLPLDKLIVNDYLMNFEGVNLVKCFHKEHSFEYILEITAIKKLTNIECCYIGKEAEANELIYSDDVIVTAMYLINMVTHKKEAVILTSNEWSFQTFPIISAENNGELIIKYKNVLGLVIVPFKNKVGPYLQAFWDGGVLEPGTEYDPFFVSIVLHYDKNHHKIISERDCQFNSFTVNEGVNIYTVTYNENNRSYRSRFTVYGEYPIIYEDMDLLIIWKTEDGDIDITESFKLKFYNQDIGKIVISWTNFQNVCIENQYQGSFVLVAPMWSGLFNRYPTMWDIELPDMNGPLLSMLSSIHIKEINHEESV